METTTNSTTAGTLEHINPSTLVIEANVRTSAPITPEFVASIRASGVITPLLARRDEQGNVIVRAGQRRTLGAREAGVATVPVYVVDADEKIADRIIQQIIENDQRAELSTADRTAAWAQLAFEGISVASIAKRTGVKRASVEKGLAVAASQTATDALHSHALTLDQAAVLLEFEGDEDARQALIATAETDPAQFEHVAQQYRDEAAAKAAVTALEAEWSAAGYQIITWRDVNAEGSPWVDARWLRTAEGERATKNRIEQVPVRGAIARLDWHGEEEVYVFVQDPEASGLIAPGGAPAAPLTEEARAEKSAERKILIALNKAWKSAETVRREWIKTLLSRKSLPKDADRVIADALTTHRRDIGSSVSNGNALAHDLFGLDRPAYGDALAPLVEQSPTKARLVSLAVVLGGMESATHQGNWRYGNAHTAAYLRQLAAWGYPLSPVEQVVTGDMSPADAARVD